MTTGTNSRIDDPSPAFPVHWRENGASCTGGNSKADRSTSPQADNTSRLAFSRVQRPWPPINSGLDYKDRVKEDYETALSFYTAKHGHTGDAAFWRERFDQGQITLNGEVVGPDRPLKEGDKLVYSRPPWVEFDSPDYIEVAEAEGGITVVNKPSGLQVLAAGGFQQRTVLSLLRAYDRDRAPAPVHRLGRGTSGLLLCARDHETRRFLSQQIAEKTEHASRSEAGASTSGSEAEQGMEKIYLAICKGHVPQDEGWIRVPIGPVEYPILGGLYQATEGPTGRPAVSFYRVLDRRRGPDGEPETLCEVTISTGRAHQIRIHMASINHPLLGDPLYIEGGVPQKLDGKPSDLGYFLHCWRMTLQLPDGSRRTFEVPPPERYGYLKPLV